MSRGFSFAKMGQAPLSDAEAWSSSSTCWSISTRRDDSGCSRPSQTICTSADGEWGNRGFLGYGNPKPWVPLISLILPTLGWFWDNPHDFGKLQILRISCCVFFLKVLKRSHGGTMHGKELPFEQGMNMKTSTQSVVSWKLHEEFQLPLELDVQTACWRWCCWWIWGICWLSLTMVDSCWCLLMLVDVLQRLTITMLRNAPRPVRELRRFPNMHTYCFSRVLRRRQCSRQSRARCRLSLGWWNFWCQGGLGWVFSCRKCSWNSNWLNWRTIEPYRCLVPKWET